MILCCTSFTDLVYTLPLTRGVLIPYTRYSEIADAISKSCIILSGKVYCLESGNTKSYERKWQAWLQDLICLTDTVCAMNLALTAVLCLSTV